MLKVQPLLKSTQSSPIRSFQIHSSAIPSTSGSRSGSWANPVSDPHAKRSSSFTTSSTLKPPVILLQSKRRESRES